MATRNEQTSARLSAARSAGALAAVVSTDAPLNGYNLAHALHVACALAPGGEGGEGFARALATVFEQVAPLSSLAVCCPLSSLPACTLFSLPEV
jgi:hypothetical protein